MNRVKTNRSAENIVTTIFASIPLMVLIPSFIDAIKNHFNLPFIFLPIIALILTIALPIYVFIRRKVLP